MTYKLLDQFANLFAGVKYQHRVSTHGDAVARRLFEDLYVLDRSPKLISRVDSCLSVLNVQNRRHGVAARRGDGTFGELVPGAPVVRDIGFIVGRGPIATIEIGVEVKILAKAMIKQIDRVINDLDKQAAHFKSKRGHPITVGIVGINSAPEYRSYEGGREYLTTGSAGYRHPVQEAAAAEERLVSLAAPKFDEFLVLRFIASNQAPFSFEWVSKSQTAMDYGAVLARISQQYEMRF